MGRSRVKGCLKRAVFTFPNEIWTATPRMRAQRGSWAEYFGDEAPIQLELGMGRGRFLAELAAREDPLNYVGVEVKADRCVAARAKILKRARRPFIVLNAAGEILPQFFAPGEIKRIFLNFPDPWPAFVYRSRRMFGENFLRMYQALLPVGGELWFKSDQPAAYEELLSSLPRHLQLQEHGPDLHIIDDEFKCFVTEYERHYLAAGAQIHYARLVKIGTRILHIRATA